MTIDRRRRRAPDPIEIGLGLRALVFAGRRHHCPACGVSVRSFCGPRGSFRRRDSGYCPRCNGKSRHRFLAWLMAEGMVPRPGSPFLLVAPSFAERRMFHTNRVVLSNRSGLAVDVIGDIRALPAGDGTIGTVVCVHVLEHVDDDEAAIREMRRVVAEDGLVIVGVPFDGRAVTDEDESVTDPLERKARFGETDHRRAYGEDLVQRLTGPGFSVEAFFSADMDRAEAVRYGIRPDEAVLVGRATTD